VPAKTPTTDAASKNRLRPSLLDRLTDHAPDSQVELPRDQTVTENELRELVRRDLSWLFNTTHMAADTDLSAHPNVQSSILNFGIVDLTGQMLSSIQLDKLQQRVLEALRSYEPRLASETIQIGVQIGSNKFGSSALIIDIAGQLRAEPLARHDR
jgi:type VI secretion system protein ImpF